MRPGPTAEPPDSGAALSLPTLNGDGVRLRPWEARDAGDLAAAWSDPLIAAACEVPADRSQAAAARWIAGAEERARRSLAVDLAAVDPGDGRVLGEVGISGIDQRRRAALIGWWTAPAERGRGVATAAVRCFASWALADAGLEVLVAQVGHDNLASLAVARNVGFELPAPSTPESPAVLRLSRSGSTI